LTHFSDAYRECLRSYRVDARRLLVAAPGR
jgi:hypothetical protein